MKTHIILILIATFFLSSCNQEERKLAREVAELQKKELLIREQQRQEEEARRLQAIEDKKNENLHRYEWALEWNFKTIISNELYKELKNRQPWDLRKYNETIEKNKAANKEVISKIAKEYPNVDLTQYEKYLDENFIKEEVDKERQERADRKAKR